ncbi:YbfB/YjiJ family MFS transporter [Rhodoligotrophos defluvii]|uniref:YbfB/YjiJ family MFS transporter n=1 Tax=Rhodoligotrophos defluvii TaxID=2561934 RepID=UPI001EEFE641|nr:YbfB/YjiJ family MFS transporter [Rhodoligotrophos defluvii]
MTSRGLIIGRMLALAMAPAAGLGIARFAYALVLPDMRDSLSWSYAEAGWMNTINALGYLLGAVVASQVTNRLGERRSTIGGTIAAVIAMAVSGLTADFTLLSLARLAAGVGAAIALVAGGTRASQFANHTPAPARALGVFYIGPSIGILISGAVIPGFMAMQGPGSWAAAWLLLAGLGAIFALWVIIGAPEDEPRPTRTAGPSRHAALRPMLLALSGYFLFGAGYIAYMTFMIAWIRQIGGGTWLQSAFWCVIALSAILGTSPWSGVVGRMKGGRGLALMMLLVGIGAALPLVIPNLLGLLLSAIIFGMAFFTVVAATTIFVRANYPSEAWASGIAAMTVSFSLGQVAGPVAIGIISDATGELNTGLWISAALLMAGAVAAWLQPPLKSTIAA